MGDRLKKRGGKARRQWNPQAVAIAGRIFSGNQSALAGDAELQQSTRSDEAVYLRQQIGGNHATGELFARKVAKPQA